MRPKDHESGRPAIERDIVRTVRTVFSDLDAVAGRLSAGPGPGGGLEAYPPGSVDEALRSERTRTIAAGVRGLEKIGAGRVAEIEPDERLGLEAIVVLEGRPPLLIRDGSFEPPPAEWAALESARAEIESAAARVGRIEVLGHPNLDWVGTGFVAGEQTILTNRHVAVEFAASQEAGWSFRPGMETSLDFRAESGAAEALGCAVTEVLGVHDVHDLAVLRVEATRSDGSGLPEPLAVAASEPADLDEAAVYVVGHPAWDGRRNDPEPMRRLFLDIYNVKRLQPGATVPEQSDAETLAHDCSTLGGNSGSPVLSLSSHRVVGLHFGGKYAVGNYAVPLWTLVNDPLLRLGGLNFE